MELRHESVDIGKTVPNELAQLHSRDSGSPASRVVTYETLRDAQFFGYLTGIHESIMPWRMWYEAMDQGLAIAGEIESRRTACDFRLSRRVGPRG